MTEEKQADINQALAAASAIENGTTATAAEAAKGTELLYPVVRGSQHITHVQLRRPKARELRGISLSALMSLDTAAVLQLLPRITEPTLLAHEVDQLDPVDLVNLSSEVVDFLVPPARLEAARAIQAERLESLGM